ncbi:MAG TPA: helix-hairpin-helix domain-containing protein [Desulfomonilia bacterium]|nr:helix-hairpin-helix domain-containing protein [Desulfomonilia bacterium]
MKKMTTFIAVMFLVFVAAHASQAAVIWGQVNVNTASYNELLKVPYINGEIAHYIIEFRNANGPFKSVDDLLKVEGVNKKTLKEMRRYIVLEGKTTIERLEGL